MKTSLYSQHEEHQAWLNQLAFYKDELILMQKKLEEVSRKNTGAEIRKSIEHFQNQLIIQGKNSDDLQRQIKAGEKQLQQVISANPVASDHKKQEDHKDERENITHFERHFNQLRQEFNRFLAEVL